MHRVLLLILLMLLAAYGTRADSCTFRGRIIRDARGSDGMTVRIPVPGVPVIAAQKPVTFFGGREFARTITDAHGEFALQAPCRGVALVALFMAPDNPRFPMRFLSSMHRAWNQKDDPSPTQMNDILMGPLYISRQRAICSLRVTMKGLARRCS